MIISGDLRFKDGRDSGDYVVFAVIAAAGANRYLLDIARGRWSFKETGDELLKLIAKWPNADAKIIENKANGPAIVSALSDTVPGLQLVEPVGGKQERVQAITPFHLAGNLWVPVEGIEPWSESFVHECATFPNGAHDDQVDALTQGILYLKASDLEYLRAMAAW